tara:strand:- start:128 stop:238 length:111 start_codon:yes stop_codon:yes gene_type:complete
MKIKSAFMLINPIEPFEKKIWKEASYKSQKNKDAPS